jgi:hypothetical protein
MSANLVRITLQINGALMNNDRSADESLDPSVLHAILIRWRLAEEFLLDSESDEDLANHAMQILIREDFPMLLKELTRLRPELSHLF